MGEQGEWWWEGFVDCSSSMMDVGVLRRNYRACISPIKFTIRGYLDVLMILRSLIRWGQSRVSHDNTTGAERVTGFLDL